MELLHLKMKVGKTVLERSLKDAEMYVARLTETIARYGSHQLISCSQCPNSDDKGTEENVCGLPKWQRANSVHCSGRPGLENIVLLKM